MERKVKYDLAFKLKCVKEVLEKHKSVNSVSLKENISRSMLDKWVVQYETYGIYGLIPKGKNNSYSQEFKYNVISTIEKQNLSLSETCLKFNIPSESIILKWQKDFTNFGLEGLKSKTRGLKKNMNSPRKKILKTSKVLTREEELLIENERLRCENAFLKKLRALVQEEEEELKKRQRKP